MHGIAEHLRREEHGFSTGKGSIQLRTRHSRYFGKTLLFILAVLFVTDLNAQQNWVSVSSTAPGYVVHCATNPQNTAFPGGANAPTLNIIPFGGKLYAIGQLNNDCPIPPHSSDQQISPILSVSTDGGKSWSPSSLKGTFDNSPAVTIVPSSGFAIGDQLFITYVYGGNSGGIASSKDGITWGPTVRISPDCAAGNLTGLAKNTTFVLQCGTAVLTSADNGMTWREPLPGAFLPTGSVATWCIYGNDVILCGNFVQGNDLSLPQFFRSRDLGITWESIEIPLVRPNTNSQYVRAFLGSADALFIQLQPVSPYSGLSETMFLYSTDGGTSWHFESLPFLSISLVASPLDKRLWILPNPVGLGGLKGVTRYFGFFQSEDEGQSWSGATAGLPDPQGMSSLYVSGNWLETVYLSTSDSRSLWVMPLGTQH